MPTAMKDATKRPTSARRRIRRVVEVAVRGFSLWENRVKDAVASQGVGVASRVEVEARLPGARQRPVVFIALDIATHHKDRDRLLFVDAVVYAFQVMVKPTKP